MTNANAERPKCHQCDTAMNDAGAIGWWCPNKACKPDMALFAKPTPLPEVAELVAGWEDYCTECGGTPDGNDYLATLITRYGLAVKVEFAAELLDMVPQKTWELICHYVAKGEGNEQTAVINRFLMVVQKLRALKAQNEKGVA